MCEHNVLVLQHTLDRLSLPGIDADVVRQRVGQHTLQKEQLLALTVPVDQRHRLQVVLQKETTVDAMTTISTPPHMKIIKGKRSG